LEDDGLPDFLTKAERSVRMSRIRGKNTGPERGMFRMLRHERVYFARHARGLPGSPDIVFRRCRLAVFIDGDFWHGRHFDRWSARLTDYWREKIEANVRRDRRDRERLRALGWHVLRIWGKDIARNPDACVRKILDRRSHFLRD
jgi:DNA mismatch endonuclease (patch repair protein)